MRLRSARPARWLRLLADAAKIALGCTSAAAFGASTTLSYSAPTANVDGSPLTDLVGYRIHSGCSRSGRYERPPISVGLVTSHVVDGLPDGVRCYFAVTAVNAAGRESALSNEASKSFPPVEVRPPGKPSLKVEWREAPKMALIYAGGLSETDFSDGTTNAGWAPQNFIYGGHITIPSSGTVTQLGVKCLRSGSAAGLKFGLYDSGGNLVAQSTGSVDSGTLAWVNSGVMSASVSAGTYYVLVSAETSFVSYGFDTSGDGSFATEAYATAMADPETITGEGDTGQLYGVRVDFTAGGGGGAVPRSNLMLLGVGN